MTITIYVRHSQGCKYAGDELARRCNCRKHFRWTLNGKQFRRKAGARTWAEAEAKRRILEDELSSVKTAPAVRDIRGSIETFLADKRVQGVTDGVLGKYSRELVRLAAFCEGRGVYTVLGIDRELLTGFCATWPASYPSSTTRSKVRERIRGFLRYCFEAQWIPRIPTLPRIKIEQPPTMPLTPEQYARLLDTIPTVVRGEGQRRRVRALFQLMRYSGLAIRDALTIKPTEIQDSGKFYRVVTHRQKTGSHVSVVIPTPVAREVLSVSETTDRYVFWSGNGMEESITKNWAKYYIAPVFKAAGLDSGHMQSHRLRDTFAVEALSRGVPMEEVSRALGHSSIKTTEKHYAQWAPARQNRLDELISGTWGDI